MQGWSEFLRAWVQVTGPVGAMIASVIVGLGLVLIAYAKSAQLFGSARESGQKGELIDHFVAEVDRLAAAEADLGAKLERISEQYDKIKDQQRELQTKVELLRSALRRAIDLLRAVREGRMPPEAIGAADTAETTL